MNLVSRTLEIDADTDARLREMATERGQEVAAVLAEAVALLDSVVDLEGPDIAEDRRRLDEFERTRLAIPLDEVKAWVASWGSEDELPRPQPRKVGRFFFRPTPHWMSSDCEVFSIKIIPRPRGALWR
jgi:predicted transcriptional regulator